MSRLVAIALVAWLVLVAGSAHAQLLADPAVREALRSGDLARASGAVASIERFTASVSEYAADLIQAGRLEDATLRRRIRALLEGGGEMIAPSLLAAARGEHDDDAVLALRCLGSFRDPRHRAEIFPLLDHSDARRAAEATRCLFMSADPALDAWFRERMTTLRTELAGPAPHPLCAQRYENTLQFLARRGDTGVFSDLVACLRRPEPSLRRCAVALLAGLDPTALRARAETLVKESRPETLSDVLDAVEAVRDPDLRRLAYSASRDSLPAPVRKLLDDLMTSTDRFTGRLRPAGEASSWRLEVTRSESAESPARTIVLEASAAHPDRVAFTGLDLDLGLERILLRPDRWNLSLVADDKGSTLRATTRGGTESFVVGLGNAVFGLWVGRQRIRAEALEIRFDPAGRPLVERFRDARGATLAEIGYQGWFELGAGRWAPRSLSFRGPRFRIAMDFATRDDAWHLSSAATFRGATPLADEKPIGRIEARPLPPAPTPAPGAPEGKAEGAAPEKVDRSGGSR
ncbi:MAG: hypothetical protein R3F20_01590 [Planctomycetota bacterium]